MNRLQRAPQRSLTRNAQVRLVVYVKILIFLYLCVPKLTACFPVSSPSIFFSGLTKRLFRFPEGGFRYPKSNDYSNAASQFRSEGGGCFKCKEINLRISACLSWIVVFGFTTRKKRMTHNGEVFSYPNGCNT